MLTEKYNNLFTELNKQFSSDRLFSDELQTLAYGTDASFYRLTPKIVVKVKSEKEVVFVIKQCDRFNIPITFRASGTSLSGQSISESVLMVTDRSWNKIKISDDKSQISLQPSTLGGRANLELSRFNKKIGPDPASINAATVIGIAANNASGMTSGVIHNSYNTVADMRIIFANGYLLDTSDEKSKKEFLVDKSELVAKLLNIADDIKKNSVLNSRISKKYEIKNTTGYGVNSYVDFNDPIEIIKHLMIGSEGTLGFISEITFNTVPSLPFRATALLLFPDINSACSVIPILKNLPVDAAEIMDRASLKSVENKPGLPVYLKSLDQKVASLLIETSANNENQLLSNINNIQISLSSIKMVRPIEFTSIKKEYLKLWNVRKGLFPSVSKARKAGTTVVIEDVNFDTSKLAEAVTDLQKLFDKHKYDDTIIWGHALSGNIHFVFAQDFNKQQEVKRYENLMNDIVVLVIEKYDGSLKAEHGTGRNMAPFVKYEWGEEIYEIMCRTKELFDINGILNPGVLINNDSKVHLKNLKPTPIVNEIIDKCIDCGFCESVCPSNNLTLTPRQRITVWRKIFSLKKENSDRGILNQLEQKFIYQGEETCATDGLCELNCPVGIDTGKLIKDIRNSSISKTQFKFANMIANNFSFVLIVVSKSLKLVSLIQRILGNKTLGWISRLFRKISGNSIPLWNKFLPNGTKVQNSIIKNVNEDNAVVYFPSCISRTMGNYNNSKYTENQTDVMQRLLKKGGYEILYPEKLNSLCCGMPFSSKGFFVQANQKGEELYAELLVKSKNGKLPILFDTSPCVKTFKNFLKENNYNNIQVLDSVEFIHDKLLDKLTIKKKLETITIHSTCSSTKMELGEKLNSIAKTCAEKVFVPKDVNCCGFAGDRGFSFPELNKSALQNLKSEVTEHQCSSGYSSSKTCEIGLSLHSGIEYNSIIYLVDDCSE